MIYPNGFCQSGYWKNNARDPRRFHGRTLYPDMSVFQGFYINGIKEGQGQYYWAHGDSYDGDHMHGQSHGKGRYTW